MFKPIFLRKTVNSLKFFNSTVKSKNKNKNKNKIKEPNTNIEITFEEADKYKMKVGTEEELEEVFFHTYKEWDNINKLKKEIDEVPMSWEFAEDNDPDLVWEEWDWHKELGHLGFPKSIDDLYWLPYVVQPLVKKKNYDFREYDIIVQDNYDKVHRENQRMLERLEQPYVNDVKTFDTDLSFNKDVALSEYNDKLKLELEDDLNFEDVDNINKFFDFVDYTLSDARDDIYGFGKDEDQIFDEDVFSPKEKKYSESYRKMEEELLRLEFS